MADTATSLASDGKKSVYDVFKKSTYSNAIDMAEYKYMFGKVLESQLVVMEMINWVGKGCITSMK
eukprot:13786498-Ditylum_brightwellii.AAC.1